MYYEKVILSISAMLFVGAASYARPVAGDNSSLVGQTGTSQNAQVHQIGTTQSSRLNKRSTTMMRLCIKV
jgi:hypothetical protein